MARSRNKPRSSWFSQRKCRCMASTPQSASPARAAARTSSRFSSAAPSASPHRNPQQAVPACAPDLPIVLPAFRAPAAARVSRARWPHPGHCAALTPWCDHASAQRLQVLRTGRTGSLLVRRSTAPGIAHQRTAPELCVRSAALRTRATPARRGRRSGMRLAASYRARFQITARDGAAIRHVQQVDRDSAAHPR